MNNVIVIAGLLLAPRGGLAKSDLVGTWRPIQFACMTTDFKKVSESAKPLDDESEALLEITDDKIRTKYHGVFKYDTPEMIKFAQTLERKINELQRGPGAERKKETPKDVARTLRVIRKIRSAGVVCDAVTTRTYAVAGDFLHLGDEKIEKKAGACPELDQKREGVSETRFLIDGDRLIVSPLPQVRLGLCPFLTSPATLFKRVK